MLAPMVAFMRLPLMAAEAGNSAKAAETAMAVNEKAAAIAQGLFAAQMSLFGAAARFWPEVASGRTPSMLSGRAMEESIQAALKPASRRVKANFRRLSAKALKPV